MNFLWILILVKNKNEDKKREGEDWVSEVGGEKCDGFRRVVIGGATMTFSTNQKTVSHNQPPGIFPSITKTHVIMYPYRPENSKF